MTSSPRRAYGVLVSFARINHKRLVQNRNFHLNYILNKSTHDIKQGNSTQLAVEREHPSKILAREFPGHYKDGKFISRMSYVEFIDEALKKVVDLGVHKDIETYKELLRIFPPGRFWPTSRYHDPHFHAPQQLAVQRVFFQMAKYGLSPDRECEKLVVDAFSKASDTWIKVCQMNYWSMKGRNLDPYPLPEKLPKEPHQLAKLGIARMMVDENSLITVTNTSQVPGCVDRTWLVFAQSPTQKAIIDKLDEKATLYIEQGGLTFVGHSYLSYYMLKYYVDDETKAKKALDMKPKPDFNYNTLKMSFYGKPLKHKLSLIEDKHYVDGYYVLSIGATGTSSQDSLLSWLKILQQRNPKLSSLNVVFEMSRQSPEIVPQGEALKYRNESKG